MNIDDREHLYREQLEEMRNLITRRGLPFAKYKFKVTSYGENHIFGRVAPFMGNLFREALYLPISPKENREGVMAVREVIRRHKIPVSFDKAVRYHRFSNCLQARLEIDRLFLDDPDFVKRFVSSTFDYDHVTREYYMT